jgi:hypothetical protein
MIILFIAVFEIISPSSGCTIFTITDGEVVLFGNNEDNFQSRHGRIWSYPAANEKYGLILFGFRIHDDFDVPVGGVNDQGLCVDMNAISRPPLTVHPEKEYFSGSFKKILEECSTVAEVREWVKPRDITFLQSQQAHFADKTGDAAVMGLSSDGETYFTNKTYDYLISTNFNLAQENYNRLYWRYGKAEEMLGSMDTVTVDNSKLVLNATALSIICYSYILDLSNGLIYLYSFGDFERVAVLSIEELVKNTDSYDIETLVSQQTGMLITPAFINLVFSLFILVLTVALFILLYILRILPDLTGKDLSDEFKVVKTASEVEISNSKLRSILAERQPAIRLLIFIGVFSFLLILAKIITVPLYLDLEYMPVTMTIHVSFTFIIIYIAGIANRPLIAFFTSSIGLLLGEIIFWLLHENSIIELPVYILLSLCSFGAAALIISLFRGKNKVFAMTLGCIWASFGWYFFANIYYNGIISLGSEQLLICTVIMSVINVILLPIALVINKTVEITFRVKFLDDLIFIST